MVSELPMGEGLRALYDAVRNRQSLQGPIVRTYAHHV